VIKLVDLLSAKIPFKIFKFWADHPDFLLLAAKMWEETVAGTQMYLLCTKLRRLKVELKYNKESFSNLSDRANQAKEKVEKNPEADSALL
jgi:hypothetical protein